MNNKMSRASEPRKSWSKRSSFSRKNQNDLTTSLLDQSMSKSARNHYEFSPIKTKETSQQEPTPPSLATNDGYGYDFVIVMDNPAAKASTANTTGQPPKSVYDDYYLSFDEIIERLVLAKFDLYMFYSNDEKQSKIFIKIHAGLDVLMKHAEIKEYPLLAKEHYLRTKVDNPHAPIAHDVLISPLHPYEFIYINYSRDKKEMFTNAKGYNHPFSDIIRVKLILSIISSIDSGCCSMNLDKLLANKSIVSYYPLHNDDARTILTKHWFPWSVRPWHQPIDEIKEYFGEKIGIYYLFFGHYSTWLLPLTIAGLVVSLDLVIEAGLYDSVDQALVSGYMIPFYCVFVSFWAQLMLEYWKRKEVTKAMEWGQTDFEETEIDRPQFRGDYIQSPTDGKRMKYFSPSERAKRMLYSYFIISLMILLVITCVSLIFLAQYFLNERVSDDQVKSDGSSVTSIGSAIQIVVLKMIYGQIAENLTEHENHRTETEFEDSLIVKLFAFNFVNSYASLIFVAFIKTNVEPCQGSCMVELSYQLTVIFGKFTMSRSPSPVHNDCA
jgi:hypothetical protein